MNVTVNSQHLAAELRLLNRIVPTKPAIAILSHVLVTAGEGLSLYATDLEVGLSSDCPAQVTQPGTVALPVGKMLALVEQFPDADVTLMLEAGRMHVRCGAFRSRMQVMPVADFPRPSEPDGSVHALDGESLRRLIDRTRYAVNAVSSKYVLQGALLTLTSNGAAMAATDSKRLALATAAYSGLDARIVIPVKALDALLGQLDASEVEMTVGGKHLHFAIGGRLLMSRTIDGEFPRYERIIPTNTDKLATIDKHALTAALRRVGVVSEENRATYFSLAPGTLELATQSAEVGSAVEGLAANYDGPALKLCVNGSFVLDFLNAASSVSVAMHVKDANSAMMLTDGDDHVGVVMLMKG